MKISELAAATGVPLATVKLYRREGMLMPGQAISQTQASYGPEHVERVNLIRTLSSLPGYSYNVLRTLFGLVDDETSPVYDRVVAAMQQLPGGQLADSGTDRAQAAVHALGVNANDSDAAMPQLEAALAAAEAVGLRLTPERLGMYWTHIQAIAAEEVAGMDEHTDGKDAVQYAIAGTAIYEPLVLALRRLAHQQLFNAAQH